MPREAQIINNYLSSYFASKELLWQAMYWDDIARMHIDQLEVYTRKINRKAWQEIDTIDDYQQAIKPIDKASQKISL